MKNRIALILLVCLLLTGCSFIHKKEKQSDERIIVDYFVYNKIDWNCEVPLSEIKEIQYNYHVNNYFITKDGKLYSFGERYSNEQMCKRVESDIFFDNFYIYPSSGEVYILVDQLGNFYGMDKNYNIVDFYSLEYSENNKYLKKYYDEISNGYITSDFSNGVINGEILYYIKDNKIYKKTLDQNNKIISDEFFAEFPNDEKFISLNGKAFKTDKSYYLINSVNFEECNKYKDVKCINGLLRINYLSDHYDDVTYYNDSFIIIDNQLYEYSGYDPDRF